MRLLLLLILSSCGKKVIIEKQIEHDELKERCQVELQGPAYRHYGVLSEECWTWLRRRK